MEFGFELRLCARLEAAGELVGRQLGAGVRRPAGRIVDAVCVEPGPAFGARAAITDEAIPDLALRADVGVGRARYWKDAFPDVGSERARAAMERAVEVGYLDVERRGGREHVRATARYPDWFGRLRTIENKPDLAAPGDLETQLRKDVSLALADEAVLATASHVTRAHLNRIPEEVGVLRFRDGELEVVREPARLPVDEPGIEIIEEHAARAEVRVVSAEEKAAARRRLAERAYGKGWRTYDLPGCANAEAAAVDGVGGLPGCAYHGRLVDPSTECGPSCPGHDPSEPPGVDPEAERDRTSPWVADPEGRVRRQSRLDRFG